jgi:hypothetical protein
VLLAVYERDPSPHDWEQVRPVEPPPPGLRHVEELMTTQTATKPISTSDAPCRSPRLIARGNS